MNPDQPSREQIEARITALLLGELPANEAELLRWTISQDAELQKLHGRLLLTVGLVREVVAHPEEASAEKTVPRKLSDERRQKLLAYFKTPRPAPKQFFWLKRIEVRPLVTALALVAIVAVAAAMLLPALASAKRKGVHVTMMPGRSVDADIPGLAGEHQSSAAQQPTVTWSSESAAAKPKPVTPGNVGVVTDEEKGSKILTGFAFSVGNETVAPPPRTQIILPKVESAPVESEPGGVYSQGVVGYANVAAPRPESAAAAPAPATDETEIRVFPLKHGSPTELAKEVGSVFEKASQQNSQNGSSVSAVADSRIQAVVVTAPKDVMTQVAGLMDELDIPSARDRNVAVVSQQNSMLQQRMQNGVGTITASIGGGAIAFGGGHGGAGGFGGGGGGRGGGGFGGRIDEFGTAEPVANANSVDLSGSAAEGRLSDSATLERIPQAGNDKTAASTLVQDGRLLYEMGKFKEAEDKLNQALKADPNDQSAFYYLNLDKQASFGREEQNSTTQAQDSMVAVAKAWSPKAGIGLPVPNPNASTAPATPTETTLAWNDSGTDRSRTDNQLGDGWHGGALLGPIPNTGSGQTGVAANERLRGVSADVAGDVVALQDKEQSASGEKFYRNPAGETSAEKAPTLGDVPLVGRWFAGSAMAPTVAPARSSTPVPTINGYFDDTITTDSGPKNMGEDNKRLPQSDGGTLALNGANTFAGESVANAGTTVFYNFPADGVEATDKSSELNLGVAVPKQRVLTGFAFNTGSSGQQQSAEVPQTTPFQQRVLGLGLPAAAQDENNKLAHGSSDQQITSGLKNVQGGAAGQASISVDPNTHNLVVADKETEEQIRRVISSFDTPANKPQQLFLQATNAIAMDDSTFNNGLTRDDVNGLRYLVGTNAVLLERQISGNVSRDQQLASGMQGTKVAGTTAANPSEMITQIVPVRFVEPRQLVAKLASSVSPQTTIVANEAGNSIVITDTRQNVKRLTQLVDSLDVPLRPAATNAPIPQPEFLTRENAFSTFSMNVSDVSFKLVQASLQKGQMPDPATIRSEEFINAFNYRDPEATAGQPLAFASERARDPFAHNRDFLRFSVKTGTAGRPAGRALNLVLLLDTSGSMERADRVAIIREALRVLAAQLQPQDTVSVVTFARTARLWADGVSGDKAGATLDQVGGITPDGGTNLEEAMRLAYETARRHYLANGMNRVVLLTDGAANLGNVDPGALKQKVEAQRRQGIALDCFGIGWEDFNDDLLEQLSGNGDGRYAFINSPDEAGAEFAAKLAGALQVAAQDVKVQVEFNPQRVISWRQIGYAKHQLTKEQFRDNSVLAAEIAAQEAGNALYTVETKPDGTGPIATVYVRYRIPGTQDVRERSWTVDGDGTVPALDQSSAAMRLAATAGAFSEWLAASPFAQEVTPDELLKDLSGVPQVFGANQRPQQLEWMIRQAKSLSEK
jgi:Mg-chelatase subunit ChlD